MTTSFKSPLQEGLFKSILSGFESLGYTGELLQKAYPFDDWFLPGNPRRVAPAVTFAQTPLAYDSACFAVAIANEKRGAELIKKLWRNEVTLAQGSH